MLLSKEEERANDGRGLDRPLLYSLFSYLLLHTIRHITHAHFSTDHYSTLLRPSTQHNIMHAHLTHKQEVHTWLAVEDFLALESTCRVQFLGGRHAQGYFPRLLRRWSVSHCSVMCAALLSRRIAPHGIQQSTRTYVHTTHSITKGIPCIQVAHAHSHAQPNTPHDRYDNAPLALQQPHKPIDPDTARILCFHALLGPHPSLQSHALARLRLLRESGCGLLLHHTLDQHPKTGPFLSRVGSSDCFFSSSLEQHYLHPPTASPPASSSSAAAASPPSHGMEDASGDASSSLQCKSRMRQFRQLLGGGGSSKPSPADADAGDRGGDATVEGKRGKGWQRQALDSVGGRPLVSESLLEACLGASSTDRCALVLLCRGKGVFGGG